MFHIGYVSDIDTISIPHGYSRIRTHDVSELIIFIFKKHFIGYLDTTHIYQDTFKILHKYVTKMKGKKVRCI